MMEQFFFLFGHYLLKKVREEKEKCRAELHLKIKKEMYKFLSLESGAVHLYERLQVLRSICAQPPLLYRLNSQVLMIIKSFKSTRELIINGSWR